MVGGVACGDIARRTCKQDEGEQELLENLLIPCVNTVKEGGAEKTPCCDTVDAAGAGAGVARLTCSTVGTCSGRHRVSPVI